MNTVPGIYRIGHLLDDKKRVALVSHAASIESANELVAKHVHDGDTVKLASLWSPEHGFFGKADAGEHVDNAVHPEWGIPIYSLYGETRQPVPEMLEEVDAVLFDLQDLGVRCYTYVATLKAVLEACTEHNKPCVVCDRPIPFADIVDGPMREKEQESFVASIETPLVYGMTPAETARWLVHHENLGVELHTLAMENYARGDEPANWIPPSPAIRSWMCGICYPATVYTEALPALDCGRGTDQSFQVLGAPWMDPDRVVERLHGTGVAFEPCTFTPCRGLFEGEGLPGIRLNVTDRKSFKPVAEGLLLLEAVMKVHGADRVWDHKNTRPEFFDQLMGTDRVRKQLLGGTPASAIVASWAEERKSFESERKKALLY